MRKIFKRAEPAAPLPPPQRLSWHVFDLPQFVPLRLFWSNLDELRPWWPVLLPLLLLSGLRAYRSERARVLAARAK